MPSSSRTWLQAAFTLAFLASRVSAQPVSTASEVVEMQRAAGLSVQMIDRYVVRQSASVVTLAQERATLNSQLEAVTAEIASLNRELEALKDQIRVLQRELQALRVKRGETTDLAKLAALDAQINALQAQIARTMTDVDALLEHMRRLQDKIKTLEGRIDSVEKKESEAANNSAAIKQSRALFDHASRDESTARQLLDVVRSGDVKALRALLGGTATVDVVAQSDPRNLKLVFRTGSVVQCLSLRTVCGASQFSLTP